MGCGNTLTKSWPRTCPFTSPEECIPGKKIPHPTRQLVTVAALAVLSRPEELKLHIHAALNVGCTSEEVAEVIFQTSIYGGVPSANTALKVLKTVMEERESTEEA